MEILKYKNNIKEIVSKAVEVLKSGGIIVYPTETAYGAGVDATNQDAVSKLIEYKGFRGQKPISMAVSDIEMAKKYVNINEIAQNLYDNYLPGPVTVISESKGNVAKGVESDWKTVGIRIPDHKLPIEIVKAFGKPMTATSANVSYKPVPYSIEGLLKNMPKKSQKYIDLIIDFGELPKRETSTILDTTMNSLTVLRQGQIEFENATKKSTLISQIETDKVEETIEYAKKISGEIIEKHDNGALVFALSGELGAGKTQFAKGIGQYLGVVDVVNSPTYTIINEYKYSDGIDRILVHMDTWRIADKNEFDRSGLKQYVENADIIIIEWADKYYHEIEKLVDDLGGRMIKVSLEYLSEDSRKISVYDSK